MKILAIDPGCAESAYVIMGDDYSITTISKLQNAELLNILRLSNGSAWNEVVIEMVACYGMAVGKEVFDTCVWIGRFLQAAAERGYKVSFIYRMEEKLAICHDSKAKDSNIRQALIDRFAAHDFKSGKGTKARPDFFYGFKADIWSAFAVGVTYLDKEI